MRFFGHFHWNIGALLGLSAVLQTAAGAEETGKVDFSRDIRPILSENCFQCHGPDKENRKAKLRLDLKEEAFREKDGVAAFVPGDLKDSESWYRITTDDEDDVMPPLKSKKVLSAEQKDLIKRWIEQGAEWNSHWSYEAPKKASVPTGENPIDYFVGNGHQAKKLQFSPKANPRTLTRRLSLDLTGLPPTLADLADFKVDGPEFNPDTVISRYIASPQYGERMALIWLDAARYGDTSVMHADGPRDMWPWRDWVVQAYNENKPFNVFGIEQLAGDLMPDATLDQRIASGFNRNHATSDEGGAIPEELRVEYVVDRVRTTANVFMGLTMECAQCHDHKYDPISQKEYYSFFAYFNNHSDPGMQSRKGNQAPLVHVMNAADESRLAQVRADVKSSSEEVGRTRREGGAALKKWMEAKNEGAVPAASGDKGLKHYFAFDSGSGGVAVDLITTKVGLFNGTPTCADAKEGERRGFEFDGKTAITFEGFPDYDLKNSAFSMAAWIKVPAGAGGAVFSDMDVAAKYRGWDLWLQDGSVGTHIISDWPKNAMKVVSKEKLKPDTWQHVAVTYDGKGEAGGISIYIDGKKAENVVEQPKVTGSTKSKAPFRIGARSTNAFFKGSVDGIRIYQRALTMEEVALAMNDPVKAALATPAAKRSAEQKKILTEYFYANKHKPYRKALATKARSQLEEKKLTSGKSTTMIMADNPANKMRKTYMLDRGAYDAPKEEEVILPGTPAILPAIDASAPANRLTLAKWLFSDEHPLTARVTVNLTWQTFFGRGMVATPGDFGAQGSYPTHPELLDWLAVDFRENGWDVKRLVHQIVSSRTYQQSSHRSPIHAKRDLENHFLSRAPRFRLQAEFVRDNALTLAGSLRLDMGGPGVKPYQPPGLWAQVGLGGNPKFVQDHGEKLYRRSLYTYWKRSAPAPSMQIFDAPTREICVMKRARTNTPLQALVTLNDTQFVEAARMLAQRMMTEGGTSLDGRMTYAFQLATARMPSASELATMREVHGKALAKYQATPAAANELLSVGEAKRSELLPAVEHAALTIVASLILNLDETLTRE